MLVILSEAKELMSRQRELGSASRPGRARVPLVPIEALPKTVALAAGDHGSRLNPGKAEQ